MSDDASFHIITVNPTGPLTNRFATIELAVETARGLEASGHTIVSIKGDGMTLEGAGLRAALGEKAISDYENFPRI